MNRKSTIGWNFRLIARLETIRIISRKIDGGISGEDRFENHDWGENSLELGRIGSDGGREGLGNGSTRTNGDAM